MDMQVKAQSFDEPFSKRLKMKVFVVIPAYNESKTMERVMKGLENKDLDIIVVDDGSVDDTCKIVKNFFDKSHLSGSVYRHILNRGLGASLKTGIEAALAKNPDIIVTFDADGQHDPNDIDRIFEPIIKGRADVVIGKRDFSKMPFTKKLGNYIMNMITWIFYGIYVRDSQSGLRAFSRKAAKALNISTRGYGVSSEIVKEIKRNQLKFEEMPIRTIYTDYSMSKGTNLKVGFKILIRMIVDNLLKKG